MLAASKTDN